jgi:WD40 repeat protein
MFSDVNSTCRSNSRTILATADDFGKVKLFKYPCVVEKASSKEYIGHSSHVTRVRFSANDKFVISAGGNDKTVIVWETDFAMDDPNSALMKEEEHKDVYYDDDDEDFVEHKVDKSK